MTRANKKLNDHMVLASEGAANEAERLDNRLRSDLRPLPLDRPDW